MAIIVRDRVYGQMKIADPVLIELIRSPALLRLRKISQFGLSANYHKYQTFSRFEHSLGVLLLLRRLGATLEEQIAGLLHDVSVLAFSHVADFVFGQGRKGIEDYQDKVHRDLVQKTEIPKILIKHNFSPTRILEITNFSLLDKPIPNLCADRVDYALREFSSWYNPILAKESLRGLVNFKGELAFTNKRLARNFALGFLSLQTKNWACREVIIRYHLFAKAIEIALGQKRLKLNDFYGTEEPILKKLEQANDPPIKEIISLLRQKPFKYPKKKVGEKLVKKFRCVDPKVVVGGRAIRLSKLDHKFRATLRKAKRKNEKGIVV